MLLIHSALTQLVCRVPLRPFARGFSPSRCPPSSSCALVSAVYPCPALQLALDMLMMKGPEALEWNDKLSFIEVVGDYGPDDKIIEVGLKLP